MTPEENKLIELKYKSKQIAAMEAQELDLHSKGLLLKIHVITGWTIPENELLNILVDQFSKILVEKYSELNADEVEFAFRAYGTVIEDWGKTMNLNLLDKVLIPYLNKRFAASEVERQITTPPPPQKIFTQEELDNSARETAQAQYFSFVRGEKIYRPEANTEILRKDGLLKDGETVMQFYERMKSKQIAEIYKRG